MTLKNLSEGEEPHLKPRHYYVDLYDRHTVDRCRQVEKFWGESDMTPPEDTKFTDKEFEALRNHVTKLRMFYETGERYLSKEKTIQEWMQRDKNRDELLETAEAPQGVRCLTCRSLLQSSSKDLWHGFDDKPDRVLFMYDCPNKCLPHRSFFSDGEEWRSQPKLCPNCNAGLEHKSADDGKKLVTTYTCPKCTYTNTEEIEWTHKKEDELDEKFVEDRDRFCLTDEKGKEYQEEKWRWEELGKLVDKFKKTDEERAEKLKANPKGFHLEGAGYTCAICGDHTPEGDNWYDGYGIKCLVCQKAIDDGEIPATLAKDKDSWYSEFELDYYLNLKTPTRQKWIRQGILKARTISHFGKGVHAELFLLEDNKDFLPPKKLLESRSVTYKKDGKDWHTSQKWYEYLDPFEHLKGYKIMDYMRVIPPEEMKAREEEKKRKWEEKQARRATRKPRMRKPKK